MTSPRLIAGLALAGVLLVACKSTTAPPTPVPTTLSLSVGAISLSSLGDIATITATVKDQNGAAMTGQTVTWSVANAGVATVGTTGTTVQVTAVANGATGVTAASGSLSAQVEVTVAQVATQVAKAAGDAQTGTVGSALPAAIEIEARDARGVTVRNGGTATFTVSAGGGSVAQASVSIGANGRASTTWTLGTQAGAAQSVTASVGTASAIFGATAVAGPAAALSSVSGSGQTGSAGLPLPDSLVVRVADQYDNPVAGHPITFAATSGGGSVSPTAVNTGVNGRAATRWTLGPAVGAQTVQATAQGSLTGSPVTFTATGSTLTIAAVAPDTMIEGESITVTGSGFDAVPANNAVTIDGSAATVTSASATSLTVTVPLFDCRPVRAVNVQVSVGGSGSNVVSHPLKPADVLALGVGEQRVIRTPSQFCLQFAASSVGGDRYLVGVGATAETPAATMGFSMTGVAASPAPPAAAPFPVRGPAGGFALGQEVETAWRRHAAAEARVRNWERAVLPTLGRSMPDRRAAGLARSGGVSLAPRAVGDTVVFRIPDVAAANVCTGFKTVTTVVRAVGTAGIWHTDVSNPATDALTPAEIQAYSDTFDLHIYARDTLYFGTPSDIDANGRIEIVLSIEVNKFPQGIAGFVFGGDLFSRSLCASSDSSEVFYGHVPDPGNVAGTGARSKAGVLFQMPSLIAHEVAHNIQQSRRVVVLGGSAFMASWEAEGQAMLAQEIVGHSVLGNTVGQNYTSATARQGQGARWYGQAFSQLASYYGRISTGKAVGAPELCTLFGTTSLVTPCDPFHFYGASWAFQRYVADRFGATYAGGEVQLHRDIVGKQPNLQGVANWESVLGMSLDSVHARWAGMLYADDRVGGLPAHLRMASWNMLEILNSFPDDTYRLVPPVRSFGGFSDARSVRGGSTAYVDLTSGGARPALAVRVRDGSDAVLGTTMRPVLWVLRLQ